MKKKSFLPQIKKATTVFGLSITALVAISCSNEEIDLTEEETLIGVNESFVTPVNGGTYYIRNRNSRRYMDIEDRSNSNGANLQQFATTVNSSQTHRQWEVLSVDDGNVRLRGVDSGKSLEVRDGSNTNGANVEQRAYDGLTHQQWSIIATDSGYYRIRSVDSRKSMAVTDESTANGANIEIDNWNGNERFQWEFIEVNGTTPDPELENEDEDEAPTNNNGESAEDIIGGRDDWKLNGYTGTFRLGNDDNGLDYADDASLTNSTFFFEEDGYAVFRSYAGNPTSGGSSNSRSELREQIDGGDGFWDGTTNTERSMKWRVKVDNLPPSGNLCFGQIHERNDSFDDVIRVQAQGDGGQSTGSINLRIQGYVVEETNDDTRNLDFDMSMDTEYYFELTMRNSVVTLYELNNNGNRARTLFTSVDIGDADENYFKAGAYLQTTRENQFGSNDYGQISIRDISVSPND